MIEGRYLVVDKGAVGRGGGVTKLGSLMGSATLCKLDDVINEFLGCLLIPLCATILPTTSNKCKIIAGICT